VENIKLRLLGELTYPNHPPDLEEAPFVDNAAARSNKIAHWTGVFRDFCLLSDGFDRMRT
jgi:hypothetical protein